MKSSSIRDEDNPLIFESLIFMVIATIVVSLFSFLGHIAPSIFIGVVGMVLGVLNFPKWFNWLLPFPSATILPFVHTIRYEYEPVNFFFIISITTLIAYVFGFGLGRFIKWRWL